MKVFAAHNADENIRRESSAGGVFSIIATKVIEAGGVVYGAAFDNKWQVVHRRVDNISGLSLFRGSKYVYSKFAPAITDAINDLNDGRRVLFSGTPCQVAAMRKRAGEDENLLLVEVVCHGAPEARYWDRYIDNICVKLKKTRKDISNINFRDKRFGWKNYCFSIIFKDNNEFVTSPGRNPYMRAFLQNYTLKSGCYKCQFKYPSGSKADITLGDLWGIEVIAPHINNNLGTTLVIARTDIGVNSIQDIPIIGEFSLDQVIVHNKAIALPPAEPTLRSQFLNDCENEDNIVVVFDKYTKRSLVNRIIDKIMNVIRL